MESTIVKVYVQSSCTSSRKAKNWFEEQNIPHKTIHIAKQGISKELLKQTLLHVENGFDGIIKKGHFDEKMDDMSFNQLIDYLILNPSIIKTPIILQGENKLLIGFNEVDIGTFLPREHKLKK